MTPLYGINALRSFAIPPKKIAGNLLEDAKTISVDPKSTPEQAKTMLERIQPLFQDFRSPFYPGGYRRLRELVNVDDALEVRCSETSNSKEVTEQNLTMIKEKIYTRNHRLS